MADISKDALRKEIAAILKGADLAETSAKTVRQDLEEKLGCKLISRKKEIEELVMQYVEKKENGKESEEDEEEEEENDAEEDEESEEEKKPVKRSAPAKTPAKRPKKDMDDSDASDQSDAESEEEYSPKKSPPKGRKTPAKKKKGSDSDSDEEWVKKKASPRKSGGGGKGKGSGYTKSLTLSPELAALVGQESMARHEVVKKMWSIIKERDLYDPKNKQYAICDDALLKVMGVKRFRTFGMMKYLKNHFIV